MKFVAGILGLCGIGMVLNAVSNQWAFNQELHGTNYVLADIGIALTLFVASFICWGIANRRAAMHMVEAEEILARRRAHEREEQK